MKLLIALPILFALVTLTAVAGEAAPGSVPGETEITQALERGKSLRNQTALVPEALMKVAVILKAGTVPCGFTLVKIEDAKGENGGTYKLTERIKGCMPRGLDMEVVEYTGTLLMDADLALIGGSQMTTKTVTSAKTVSKEAVSAEMTVKGGVLSWVRKEKRDDDPEFVEKSDPVKLNGVRPIPHNALIAMAAFAARQPGFKAGISSPFCVPSLDTGGTIDTFLIQPAWLETTLPVDKSISDARLVLKLRVLEGDLNEKGFTVAPPNPETWADALDWTFDGRFNIVALPPTPDTYITAEMTDPDKLDIDGPLDFPKIKDAMKVLENKLRKDSERITKVPLQ